MSKYEEHKKLIYDFICDSMYVPMKVKEIAIFFGVTKKDRPELDSILAELVAEGKVELSKRGKYSKAESRKTIGTFLSHPKGFGFVTIEGQDEDIFIPADKVHGALHMDKVEVAVTADSVPGRRKEGQVVKKGQVIGIMGCTGSCTGTHLHLTIYKNGVMMDPLKLYK